MRVKRQKYYNNCNYNNLLTDIQCINVNCGIKTKCGEECKKVELLCVWSCHQLKIDLYDVLCKPHGNYKVITDDRYTHTKKRTESQHNTTEIHLS